MKARLQKINRLIKKTQSILNEQYQNNPANNQQIVSLVGNNEFTAELKFLTALFNKPYSAKELNLEADIKNEFINHCSTRAIDNSNSLLCLTRGKDSARAALYCQIAMVLFEPKSVGELIEILLPKAVKQVLIVDVNIAIPVDERNSTQIKKYHKNPQVSLSTQPFRRDIDVLNHEVNMNNIQLFDCLLVDGLLLYLPTIQRFNLKIHADLYQKLQKSYPVMANSLYQINNEFINLVEDIAFFNKGKTLREALVLLSNDLRLQPIRPGGYAPEDSLEGFKKFMNYFNGLNGADRTTIANLKNPQDNKTLGESVINHLESGNCVLAARDSIQCILNNPANTELLDKSLTTKEQKQEVENKYKFKIDFKELDIRQTKTSNFPQNSLVRMIQTKTLKSAQEYISLLSLSDPKNLGNLFGQMQQVISIPSHLNKLVNEMTEIYIKSNFSKKDTYLFKSFIQHMYSILLQSKDLSEILVWMVIYQSKVILQKILQDFKGSEEQFFQAIIKQNNDQGYTLLHRALLINFKFYELILEKLSPKSISMALEIRDKSGKSVNDLLADYYNRIEQVQQFQQVMRLQTTQGMNGAIPSVVNPNLQVFFRPALINNQSAPANTSMLANSQIQRKNIQIGFFGPLPTTSASSTTTPTTTPTSSASSASSTVKPKNEKKRTIQAIKLEEKTNQSGNEEYEPNKKSQKK